jgi:hypothetical protein
MRAMSGLTLTVPVPQTVMVLGGVLSTEEKASVAVIAKAKIKKRNRSTVILLLLFYHFKHFYYPNKAVF